LIINIKKATQDTICNISKFQVSHLHIIEAGTREELIPVDYTGWK
jgi:hypothetical protein